MKLLIQKYKHAWVLLYILIYFPWFAYLEKTVTENYTLIQTGFDEKLPFIEYFIIPYLFWFVFMAATVLYFFFKDRTEFYRLFAFLCIGMTLFLIISTIWPNGQALRPDTFVRDNIFVDMVRQLYQTDTPTNVFPSIHVYNTLGCYIAIRESKYLRQIRGIQIASLVVTILIILSTVFLKQHSFVDALGAGVIAGVAYLLAYRIEYRKTHALSRIPT